MGRHWAEQPSLDIEIDLSQFEATPLPVDERCLTEVDNLNRHRSEDGTHSEHTLAENLKNLLTATQEAAMPYAISRTRHEYREVRAGNEKIGVFLWLGKTAVENAASGLRFHRLPAAIERVKVEIDEARDAETNLRPGVTKVFISPRMSRTDATLEEARSEHLGDDDAVRISKAVTDKHGNIKARELESLLVRDIPLEAWVDMLEDQRNVFGKSISIDNPESALSIMKVYRELEIPDKQLKEGTISVVAAVVPYIKDPSIKANVEYQLGRFRQGQAGMHDEAESIAKRWQSFEVELADSLHNGKATLAVERFINSMQSEWSERDLGVILERQIRGTGTYRMDRELAVVVEKAQQKLLWVSAAVATDNEKVISQMDKEVVEAIKRDEKFIAIVLSNGYKFDQVQSVQAENYIRIAGQKVTVGGGCPGENDTEFNGENSRVSGEGRDGDVLSGSSNQEGRTGKTSRGECVVETCPTRPRRVRVGGCGVCLERCQKLYDKGQDPSRMPTLIKQAVKRKSNSVGRHEFGLVA